MLVPLKVTISTETTFTSHDKTIEAYAVTSVVNASILSVTETVAARSQTTTDVPISFATPLSSNSVILHVEGNLTAMASDSKEAVSEPFPFVT